MNGAPIRVVLADDHALVREGIRHVLDQDPGIVVVAEAATGAEAVAAAEAHRPDVVLLDITMPGETGLRAAERLRT
ncbi:MAG: response regulator, partial [Gemmatimonadetes bacterium]|nr:response regulator [Gemmatimonadota bacterium]